jgi:putative pyoverdin transport system ATP-binding/permease protein
MLKLLLNESRMRVLICALFSLGSGGAIGVSMIIVSEVIAGNFFFSIPHAAAFFSLIIAAQILRYGANVSIISLVETITVRTRLIILEALKSSPLAQFERISQSKIHNVLTTDCAAISRFVPDMIEFLTAGVSLVFCLGYLVWLSPMVFALAVLVLSMGIGGYLLRQNSAKSNLEQSRSQLERVYKLILDFMNGFKELKISPEKADDLFDRNILPGFLRTRHLLVNASRIVQLNYSIGLVLFFSLLGFVLFLLPHYFIHDTAIVSRIVVVLLYLVTPGGQFLYSALQYTKLQVALDNLQTLKAKALSMGSRPEGPVTQDIKDEFFRFRHIQITDLAYTYPAEEGQRVFNIGPLSMDITRGRIIFITGGNGSGKTTLCKLITGLYTPSEGEIRVDGKPVDRSSIKAYRSLFSVVFSDFFLFEALYGIKNPDQTKMQQWLTRFSLYSKLSIENGRFSTDRISSGQRRRLALFCAVMADKPILVCDEMTADQEPGFREYFYKTFLPEMAAAGKTIVIITHDDRYFDLSDQMVTLEYGQVIWREEKR